MKYLMLSAAATFLIAANAAESCTTGDRGDVLRRFYSENEGLSLRRLPSWIVPENTFTGFGLDAPADIVQRRQLQLFLDKSDWNVLTYCCRKSETFNPAVTSRIAKAADTLKGSGIELLMEMDPRLMRNAFLEHFPDDFLRIRQFGVFEPAGDGSVRFSVKQDYMCDYENVGGMKDPYSGWKSGRLVAVRAAKEGYLRTLSADGIVCTSHEVSGSVAGLAPDERLLVEVEWPMKEIDPCSPNLFKFIRETARLYKSLGVSGVMRDEYGFQKPSTPSFKARRAFWHSPHFAALYEKNSGGRSLADDLPALALGLRTPETHRAAIAYTRSIYDASKAIEEDLYAVNKEYFGPDTYVAKHVTWHGPFAWDELLHNGLSWWAARRDWAQTDENNQVPASTGMMKKFGTPLWLNEGYGPNPEHYVKMLWRYVLCGGRMVYHSIFAWDPSKTSVARYADKQERAYRRQADLLNNDGMRAEEISRLLPLMTRAPIDCPVAHVFGYDRLVDWLDNGHCDWGGDVAHGLGRMGYYADAYPANEIGTGTLGVDGDGFVKVGKQRYLACVLYHLSDREREAWERMVDGKTLATRVFVDPAVGDVAAFLASVGAVMQTPLADSGYAHGAGNRLPLSDGVMRLVDGTAVRVKGAMPDLAGDAIAGELEMGGTKVSYSARGMFAARAENGEVTGLCGGEVKHVDAPGIRLHLDQPADIALVKIGGEWRGVWQTSDIAAPVPASLRAITEHWIKLRGIYGANL